MCISMAERKRQCVRELKTYALTCRGCGACVIQRDVDEPTLPEGWAYATVLHSTGTPLYCAGCRERKRG
jgi:hypothetical protein